MRIPQPVSGDRWDEAFAATYEQEIEQRGEEEEQSIRRFEGREPIEF